MAQQKMYNGRPIETAGSSERDDTFATALVELESIGPQFARAHLVRVVELDAGASVSPELRKMLEEDSGAGVFITAGGSHFLHAQGYGPGSIIPVRLMANRNPDYADKDPFWAPRVDLSVPGVEKVESEDNGGRDDYKPEFGRGFVKKQPTTVSRPPSLNSPQGIALRATTLAKEWLELDPGKEDVAAVKAAADLKVAFAAEDIKAVEAAMSTLSKRVKAFKEVADRKAAFAAAAAEFDAILA